MKKISIWLILILLLSCNANKNQHVIMNDSAPVIIYKTKSDYYNNVPVMLNDSKDRIVSYPAPSDLISGNKLAYPVKLHDGFLLDVRGINKNSVFTRYSYEEYSKMDNAPPLEELYAGIIDENPFISMYDCGKRSDYDNLEKELNKRIRRNLEGFEVVLE